MKRSNKIHTTAIGMLCLATITTSACVSQSTYKTATADLDAAKAALHNTSAETQELTRQVSDLQQRQSDLARQMEVASSALKHARKELKAERTASQLRLSKLNHAIQQLTAQQKSLRYAVKRSTTEQARLQSAIDSHTSNLAEAGDLSTSPNSRPVEPTKTALVPPVQTPVPSESDPKPAAVIAAAPVNQTAANPKPLPANTQPPEPVEEDWLTFLKNWIASLWESVFF